MNNKEKDDGANTSYYHLPKCLNFVFLLNYLLQSFSFVCVGGSPIKCPFLVSL